MEANAERSHVKILDRYVNLETIDDFCLVNPERLGLGRIVYPEGSQRVRIMEWLF